MKNLSANHREVLSDRLPKTTNNTSFRKLLDSACTKLEITFSDHTLRNICEGNNLTQPTIDKLIRILASFPETADLASNEWLGDPLARPPKKHGTIAASVDTRLDEYSKFQHEIDRLKGLYVIYRRHGSTGIESLSTGMLVRELLLVKGGEEENTDAYLVTKNGLVYKGNGLRYKDIWKFYFFRSRRGSMLISRTIKLQADNSSLKQRIIGGVMLRTTDKDNEASACDLFVMELPVNSETPTLVERIVSTYESKGILFPSREQAPPTHLRMDEMEPVEQLIYHKLTGTIVAPSDISGIDLDEVHKALPLGHYAS